MITTLFTTNSDKTAISILQRYEQNIYFIKDWWEYAGRADLSEGLSIWDERSQNGEFQYRHLQGIFPVLFLSFANIKAAKYEDMAYKISGVIAELYEQNRYLLKGNLLSDNEKNYYNSMTWGVSDTILCDSLRQICSFLQRYYGKEVMILLDEYDTPMQEAWLSGY